MSDRSAAYQLITATLSSTFDLPEDELRPEATFYELGLDSLALAELAVTVAEETGCSLDDLTADHTLAQTAEAMAARLTPDMARKLP